MNTIELQQTLPAVFADRDCVVSDVWHKQIAFQKGQICLVEAASGTGEIFALQLCVWIQKRLSGNYFF